MNFLDNIKGYSTTMPKDAPPIAVAHPLYGYLGDVSAKGFEPLQGTKRSIEAIGRV
jgi:hypothetical protein